jgi:hypothetical protein
MFPLIHPTFWALMFWFLAAHALCDFALQNDFMAMAKNHTTPVGKVFWPYALGAHALIHGAAVAVITGEIWLGVLETLCHAWIDRVKCDGRIDLHTDQFLHVVCKLIWILLLVFAQS